MISTFTVTEEMKRQIYIKRLLENKVYTDPEGTSIYELDYKSLRREVVMLEYRNINVESPENDWF
ncbi:hypothetical protein [Niallia sp. Krafla_26]|uniref:hypothetical protein n=1 Tax=Niallia sp. Krafla_26 TaxID=3064703 RepID=UPI003D170609